jgi:hypothetical protein
MLEAGDDVVGCVEYILSSERCAAAHFSVLALGNQC